MKRGLILALVIAVPVHADVYRYKDSKGRVWLTNTQPVVTAAPTVQPAAAAKVSTTKPLTRWEVNHYVHQAAVKYQVSERLIHAVIKQESVYKHDAISTKGAVGLMQLMPATASRFGVTDRNDQVQNIEGGVRFLRFLLDTFKDVRLALAGYNAGEHAVMRHNNRIPPYPETVGYVAAVMRFYENQG